MKYNVNTPDSLIYSNKNLGTPTYIDAANPMKILVFYPDFNSFVLLDNKLAELNVIRLNGREKNYLPAAICREEESDNIWLYDELSRKLIRLDEKGNATAQSEAFDAMFEEPVVPFQLIFHDQSLYLMDTAGKILVFDQFANFYTAFDFSVTGFVQITDKKYIFIKDNKLFINDADLYANAVYDLPEKNVLQVNLQKDVLFLRTVDGVMAFRHR